MNCTFCGSPVEDGALFCRNCGVTLSNNSAVPGAGAAEAVKSATADPQPIDAYAQINPNSPYAPQPTAAQTSAYAPQDSFSQNPYAPNNSYAQNGAYDSNAQYSQNGMYGQNNGYAPNGVYGQNNAYAQNSAYSQNGMYGQNNMYGQNGVYNQPVYGTAYNTSAPVQNDGSTPTLVLGILSLALSVTFYFSIASFIMGPISIAKAVAYKKSNGQMNAKSKTGMILSIVGISVAAIYAIIFVVAVIIAIMEEM